MKQAYHKICNIYFKENGTEQNIATGGRERESLYWDGPVRNYYPEPDSNIQTTYPVGSQDGQELEAHEKDDIDIRQSGGGPPSSAAPSEYGPVKGPGETKKTRNEDLLNGSHQEQDFELGTSSNIFVDQQNEEQLNGGVDYKTKTEAENEVNDMIEKGAAADGERCHQVNNGKVEQKKKEAEKQTSINDAEKGSWASQVNTNDLPVEVFLLFAQHKNNSAENVLPLPLME